ncbi:1246_t:CDS:2 [Paraglomus occultum]|uniref:1246_t:CDS:1 n=1 Tax=Paraglomus occultum TaxID=144539 RepID=A0A9N8YWJ6_9GLOM|nr:1246_t:CDS:2 [Paraglomus occultum]
MLKLLDAFRKDDGTPKFPSELEKNYRISKIVLGRGSFATVKECTDKRTGKKYALKIMEKKAFRGKEQLLTTEVDVLRQVKHPNIISLHDLYETKDAIYFITDLAKGGELFEELLLRNYFSEKDAANLIRQILDGVAYLHDLEIVHRDLKPENLLFRDKSIDSNIMITDFGLSKILRHRNDILTTACGTPGYVAPEVLLQVGHGKPVDLWSMGVITYALLSGRPPFYGETQGELFDAIIDGSYDFDDSIWSDVSKEAKDFIAKLLAYDPIKRMTARKALLHPWLSGATNDVNLISATRPNFSARAMFRKAVNVVQGVNRLQKGVNSNEDMEGGKADEREESKGSVVTEESIEARDDDTPAKK